jgi:hypothetical protein
LLVELVIQLALELIVLSVEVCFALVPLSGCLVLVGDCGVQLINDRRSQALEKSSKLRVVQGNYLGD